MAGFLRWVNANAPHVRVSALCAHDIEAVRFRFPNVEWLPSTEEGRENGLSDADAWIGLGDSPFQSDLGPWLLDQMCSNMEAARSRDIPCFLVGVGINNVEALSCAEGRRAIELAERVWFRDAYCYTKAIQAGHSSAKIRLGADLAHLHCCTLQPGDRHRAGLLIHAPRASLNERALSRALRTVGPVEWSWLCQEVRPLEDSETLIYNSLPHDLRSVFRFETVDPRTCTMEMIDSHLGNFGWMLSSRYHGSLVAAWSGANLCIYERNDKIAGIREELNAVRCAALDDPETVFKALSDARPIDRVILNDCLGRARNMLEGLFSELNGI